MATRWRTYLIQVIGRIRRAFSLPTCNARPSPRLTALLGTLPEGLAGFATFALRRVGPVLTVVLLGAALLGKETVKGWWTWTELLSKPGVTSVITQLRTPPRADSTQFAVLVTDFENDASGEFRHVVLEGLKEIHGIQILALERTIPYEPSDTEDARAARQRATSKALRQSAAQVLIWGTVLRIGDARVLKLFWETEPVVPVGEPFTRHEFQHSLELPESVRNRLADVLGLIVTRFRYELDAGARPFRAQELLRYISRVDGLTDPEDPHPLLDAHRRALVAEAQTDAYLVLSTQMRSDAPIVGAMMRLEKLLDHTPREDAPIDWASLEFDLGACAFALASWEKEPFKSVFFEKALTHLEAAQYAYRGTQAIARWAAAHALIAFAAHSMANMRLPPPLQLAYLSRSVAAAKTALSAYPNTQSFQGPRWLTSIILGCSLMLIGNEQHDPDSWAAAAAAFGEATTPIALKSWPGGWMFAQYDVAALDWQLWQTRRKAADIRDAQTRIRELANLPPGSLGGKQRTYFRDWLDTVNREWATYSKTSASGFTNPR